MNKRLVIVVIFSLLIGMILSACGGSSGPTTIPVYPGSTLDTGELETLRKAMEDAEKANLSGYSVELKIFITNDANDAIFAFYKNNYKDWTDGGGKTDTASGLTLQKWTKGNEIVAIFAGDRLDGKSGRMIITEMVRKQ